MKENKKTWHGRMFPESSERKTSVPQGADGYLMSYESTWFLFHQLVVVWL